MEDTVIKDDPGIFLTEILVNDGGDRFDIIATLSGTEQELIDATRSWRSKPPRSQLGRDA